MQHTGLDSHAWHQSLLLARLGHHRPSVEQRWEALGCMNETKTTLTHAPAPSWNTALASQDGENSASRTGLCRRRNELEAVFKMGRPCAEPFLEDLLEAPGGSPPGSRSRSHSCPKGSSPPAAFGRRRSARWAAHAPQGGDFRSGTPGPATSRAVGRPQVCNVQRPDDDCCRAVNDSTARAASCRARSSDSHHRPAAAHRRGVVRSRGLDNGSRPTEVSRQTA